MKKPHILDLYCGAGGAARGYQLAGFHVTGVDCVPQPRYVGDRFIQGDAIQYLKLMGQHYDAIHASCPCQQYSLMSHVTEQHGNYPDLIAETRAELRKAGRPWVIENVMRAPLIVKNSITLCGEYFGLDLYRHRRFESGIRLHAPERPHLHTRPISPAGRWTPGTIIEVVGNFSPVAEARRAMDIDWMRRSELAEAIPPAYTNFIGEQLLDALFLEGRIP